MTPLHPTNLIALRVPEGATVEIYGQNGIIRGDDESFDLRTYIKKVYKLTDYEIIGLHPGITEEQAKGLVGTIHVEHSPSPYNDWGGGYHMAYIDYENLGEYAGYNGDASYFELALKSLSSLLASHGIKENVLLILKK